MKIGDRVEYIGPHTPWRGHTGVIWETKEIGKHTMYRVGWDDPPEKVTNYAFITPYNIKQWTVLDDPRRNDREVHPASQPG